MKKCGYNELSFKKTEKKTKTIIKNKKNKKITWYNPRLSSLVKTNIGSEFINLVEKTFQQK